MGRKYIGAASVVLLIGSVFVDDTYATHPIHCNQLHNVNASRRCLFVQSTDECHFDQGYINYPYFVYCDFPQLSGIIALPVAVLSLWLLVCFVMLSTTADDYFCPALTVLSKSLPFCNENIAGVTLLAFGNGAPDIFTALVAVTSSNNGDLGLALGALLGAATFVTTVVAGCVILTSPFQMRQRPFLRDSIFYLVAVFWLFYLIYHQRVTLAHSLGFIALYIIYVMSVLGGKIVRQRLKSRSHSDLATPVISDTEDLRYEVYDDEDKTMLRSQLLQFAAQHSPVVDMEGSGDSSTSPDTAVHHQVITSISQSLDGDGPPQLLDDEVMCDFTPTSSESLVKQYCLDFFRAINPKSDSIDEIITDDGVRNQHWCMKVTWFVFNTGFKMFEIVKLPLVIILRLTTPVVRMDEGDSKLPPLGWSKSLAICHVLVTPQFCLLTMGLITYRIGDIVPLAPIIAFISLIIATLVMIFSSLDKPVVWFKAFSLLGFTASVLWIYITVNEIVNLLETFGYILNVNSSILGITLLAWANSLGDLVADTATARSGYPVMAASAAFSGTLFNVLLGVGIPFTIYTIRNGPYIIHSHNLAINYVLISGLATSLLSSFLLVPLFNFKVQRWYGRYLILLYIAFMVLSILSEVDVISHDVVIYIH